MSTTINTLQDALSYRLRRLFYAEAKVREEFEKCQHQIASPELKRELAKYIGNADDKLLKLERVFNYLMQEPVPGKNEVIDKLIAETHHTLDHTTSAHLRDIQVIGCIESINAYKIACYRTAYLFTVELELDTAADLIQQILEWETRTAETLNALSIREFNRINSPISVS